MTLRSEKLTFLTIREAKLSGSNPDPNGNFTLLMVHYKQIKAVWKVNLFQTVLNMKRVRQAFIYIDVTVHFSVYIF
jgi:hypothetical protein